VTEHENPFPVRWDTEHEESDVNRLIKAFDDFAIYLDRNGWARRVVSRSCALGSNGGRAALCRSSREACTREHTSVSWGCLLITRQFETKGRATPENTDQSSIVPICGGNAEIGSLSRVVGQFVDDARASGR
jgi:hypothetical protein